MATETYVVKAGKPEIEKDPNAVLDYAFDWTGWLAVVGDTIADVLFIPDPALTLVSFSFDANTATAFISGGVVGDKLSLTCRITTNNTPTPRVDDRTIWIKIVQK